MGASRSGGGKRRTISKGVEISIVEDHSIHVGQLQDILEIIERIANLQI